MKKAELLTLLGAITIIFMLSNCMPKDRSNRITILEGDKLEDRVIVYCTGYDNGACVAGTYVIPQYNDHYDKKGHYLEYVKEAKSNEKWMIAKTVHLSDNNERYWIIDKNFSLEDIDCDKSNCDSIIQSHVIGKLTYLEFITKTKELGIALKFDAMSK